MAEIPQQVLDYVGAQRTVTLATASADAIPHAATFMYANDGLSLYIWARPSSTTARQILENRRIAFTIDDYVDDWNKAKGIQGTGLCEPAVGEEMTKAIMLFADKFPSPRSSASTANIAFFKVVPKRVQFINNDGERVEVTDDFGPEFHIQDVVFSD